MIKKTGVTAVFIILLVAPFIGARKTAAQAVAPPPPRVTSEQTVPGPAHALTGVYRIDRVSSDQFYSTVENASSKVVPAQRQRFLIDLAARLSPPDLLAIECRGNQVTVGSSRSQPVTYVADGVNRMERARDGYAIESRINLDKNQLAFISVGRPRDNLSVTFTSIDNGTRLLVVRRLYVSQINEPIVIQTVYNKIENTVRWTDYGQTQTAAQIAQSSVEQTPKPTATNQAPKPVVEQASRTATPPAATSAASKTTVINVSSNNVSLLRQSLKDWLAANNLRDVERQMQFYMPQLQAFYLTRNASRKLVRDEKLRIFGTAKSVNITMGEPEFVFQDDGRTAIVRFHKQYKIDYTTYIRAGEVIQELRWQQTKDGWKILSERDVKVIR